ncbi:MAG TPA: CHAT domain-containing tetratricopeptide repeat protein [Pyrinomonadaceae bacterium]|nr:CHAT domain-containing tetratricopeptide repeat protein [Pyrinomonadaceae bacterium]
MKLTVMRCVSVVCILAFVIGYTFGFVRANNRVAEPTVQQTDQAGTDLKEGRRLLKRGHADQALIHLQNALKLYTSANNPRGMAATQKELGDLYLRQGQYSVALDYYQKSLEGFMVARAKPDLAKAAAGIADDQFNSNLMLAKIGEVNFRLGRTSDALSAYSRMVVKKPESAAAKVGRRFGGFGAIVGGISTGNVSVAAPTSALTVALEAKKELDEYRVAIVYSSYELGLGRIAFAGNDLPTAQKHFQNALDALGSSIAGIASLGQTRRFRAAARTSLGDVLLRQGKFKDATKFYNDAKKGAQDDKRLDLMWPAQRGIGRSLWLQASQEKDPKKATSLKESALTNYRESLATIETLRQGSLRADEARTTFLATIKDVFDEAGSAYAELALTGSTAGSPLTAKPLEYAAEAFKINEQSRARSLLDLLVETDAAISEGVPAELLKRKQDNLERQQEIAEILTGVTISSEDLKKKPAELDKELESLQTEYEAIENEIRTASPRYRSLTENQPLSLADVQQKVLDDQTVLLEYALRSDASYLWAVSKTAVTLNKLPARDTVDQLATALRAQLIPSQLQRRIVGIDVAEANRGLGITAAAPTDTAPFVTAANGVYKAVVEPAATMTTDKRLLIVADGALNYIPFEVLLSSATPGDFSSLSYLVKTNEIIYAPSASVVGFIKQQRGPASSKSMLIIADPVFNSNDTRAQKAPAATAPAEVRGLGIQSALTDVAGQTPATTSGQMQGLPLTRLIGTRTEAEQIARLAKTSGGQTDVWLDLDASEDNLTTRDISKYRIIHVATHGLLNAERPQFTGVVFSLVGNKSRDGFLRTDEVFNLRLGSPLVVLSACETGLGKEKRGEGVMGLTRAFIYAGAPTVGVSLWSVADKSTADLMTDFYSRLLTGGGTSASGALRAAQLTMISGKKYSAPFYWAPFVLVGDWN